MNAPAQTAYLLHFLDADNRVRLSLPVDCRTDADALRLAACCRDNFTVEVWHLDRFVRRLDAANTWSTALQA